MIIARSQQYIHILLIQPCSDIKIYTACSSRHTPRKLVAVNHCNFVNMEGRIIVKKSERHAQLLADVKAGSRRNAMPSPKTILSGRDKARSRAALKAELRKFDY